MPSIFRITPSALEPDFLFGHVYPNLDHSLYWSESWDPEFYVELARAGFISTAHDDPELGPLLLPEIQTSYAVLDWENLHRSRNLRRLIRSERLAREDIELRVVDTGSRVVDRLIGYHESTWILEPYRQLVRELPTGDDRRFAIHGVELWSRKRDELVAGELGYSIGATYTSLSGFCSTHDPELRHFGTLQMILLAEQLAERGYAFWNMGHPRLSYKGAIGARIVPREDFLERWLDARDAVPARALGGN